MRPERWQQVEELFHAALECEPERRTAFLHKSCQDDPELKREVESLLAQGLSSSHGPIERQAWLNRADVLDDSAVVALPAGVQVGAYRIEAPLGAGGMGVVYKAIDTKLNRYVAVKLVSNAVADAAGRRRFQREAQMASSLNHPHIVTVHDAGEFADCQYLVMEFVDGTTLKEWALAGNRSWEEVVELLIGVADGLAVAHAAGMVHRDVKPANILVATNGYAKLADFGLAKPHETPEGATRTRDGLTRPGMIVGTIAYMSPEQASGQQLDARSDVFSFGSVLYELLTRKQPFRGGTDLQVLQTIVHGTPDPLGEEIPVPLRKIVEKTLEKDLALRYQSMRDVVVDLKRVRRHTTITQTPDHVFETISSRWRHSWRMAVSVVVVLFVIALGIVWRLRQNDYFWRNPLDGARTERVSDFEGDEADASISPDGKFMAFLADRSGQSDVWLSQIGSSGEPVNVTKGKFPTSVPGVIRRVGFSGDGTQIWISEGKGSGPYPLWLASVLGGAPRPFLAGAMEPAWSPDGSAIAYHTSEPGDPIFIADRAGRNPRRIFAPEPGDHRHHLTWSPDGRFLYFVRGFPTTDEMDIWRIPVSATPSQPERITTHNARVAYLAWLDARTLIYSATAQDGSGQWLYALDVERRIPHRVSSGITEQYLSVAVSTNEPRRLIASVATPNASLWTVPISDRVANDADISQLPVPNTRALSPRVASDYLLFLSSKGGGDGLWKLKEGVATELWKGSDGGVVAAPAISRDGTQICFSYRQQGRSRLYLMNSDGTNVRLLTDLFDVRGAASWSPDGNWVAVAANDGNGTHVFKVPVGGGNPVRLTDAASYNPIWSPDGRFIVYSEPLQGSVFLTKAITPDKMPVPMPDIRVDYTSATPYRFMPGPGSNSLIFGKEGAFIGGVGNFHIADLKTGEVRQLTDMKNHFLTRSFDITPDGKQIIFDRLRDNSDIAIIDLPR